MLVAVTVVVSAIVVVVDIGVIVVVACETTCAR